MEAAMHMMNMHGMNQPQTMPTCPPVALSEELLRGQAEWDNTGDKTEGQG